jgi:hypothetical protein
MSYSYKLDVDFIIQEDHTPTTTATILVNEPMRLTGEVTERSTIMIDLVHPTVDQLVNVTEIDGTPQIVYIKTNPNSVDIKINDITNTPLRIRNGVLQVEGVTNFYVSTTVADTKLTIIVTA